LHRRRDARARATSSGTATPDRSARCAGAVRGLPRGGSDRWSGHGSRCRHARRRLARHRGAVSRRRGRCGGGRRRGARSRSRSRRRGGFRSRSRRRRGRRWCRRGCRTGREQRGGIDVRVAVAAPDAEMDVRRVVLWLAGRPGGGDRRSLGHDLAAAHAQWAEMRQRRLVPVARRDGHGEPVRRHRPGEGDLARRGCAHSGRVSERDVDASMLPARVRVVAERERAEDVAVRRPAPRLRLGRRRECAHERGCREEHPRCR
jgi:hypothetical protein